MSNIKLWLEENSTDGEIDLDSEYLEAKLKDLDENSEHSEIATRLSGIVSNASMHSGLDNISL